MEDGTATGGRVTDLVAAVRRIVVAYRLVAAGWVGLLAAVAWATGELGVLAGAVTVLVAGGWALATVAAARSLDGAGPARGWAAVAADVAVAVAVVWLPAVLSGPAASIAGGYPFSAVVVAAWLRGLPGALVAAVALSAATVARVPVGEAVRPDAAAAGVVPADLLTTALFFLIAGAVLAWGMDVLRRTGEERDAAEAALVAERADRARAEERAATAAHLHDSVLQTLALIQRRSEDPAEVVGLARSQERSLRDWLSGGTSGAVVDRPRRFAGALAAAVEEVERLHHVAVELVHVGDAPLDDRLGALVAATREAAVNAAKHAGADQVRVYAEVDPDGAVVFVRDRGVGFDPAAVPPDRRGISHSIRGRLEGVGGTAAVRSRVGEGTELELVLPAAGADPVG